MGRVSPRKFSGQSEKSASSPMASMGMNAMGGDSKEHTGQGGKVGEEGIKLEGAEDDTAPGNVPAMIEEGVEPEHRDVLPT